MTRTICSHVADYVYGFCYISDTDFSLSVLVMLIIRLFIFVCVAASLFCAGLASFHVSVP